MLTLLTALVCLPFVLALPFVSLTYAFFWYEAVNGPHGARLSELSGGRPGRWTLRGALSGVVAVGIVIVTFPLGWLEGRRQQAASAGARPPVLLIHGLYHNGSAWFLYRWWLKRAGYLSVETVQYSSWGPSFDDLAVRLIERIEEVVAREGRSVVLVGHSLGGLLARHAAQDPRVSGKIAALVTLGSPHQGSKLAALAWGSLGRSLIFRGPLIARVEERPLPDSLPRLGVITPVDNMVLPNDALHARESGWEYHETAPISHVSLLYRASTAKQVIRFLDSV